jgi:hypothetical protein
VHGYHQGLKPAAPTKALPGHADKIKIMRERVARGESGFLAADAPLVPRSEVSELTLRFFPKALHWRAGVSLTVTKGTPDEHQHRPAAARRR